MSHPLASGIAFENGQPIVVARDDDADEDAPARSETDGIASEACGQLLRWLLGDDPFDDNAILRRIRLISYHTRIPMDGIVTHSDLGRAMKLSRRRVSQLLREFSRETGDLR
jgi:hypothetical protein